MEIICCSCNQIKDGKRWKKQLPDIRKKLTHGYCPECFTKVMEKIDSRFVLREVVDWPGLDKFSPSTICE